MLRGRDAERMSIDSLLRRAGEGHGGGLVIGGESGIGKSALLAYARERSGGFGVLDAVGLEAETGLGYATVSQLLLPVLGLRDRLPAPQARALGVAFGRHDGPTPDRFLVALAALSLLSESAGERPVLCLVDDAHWADRPSLDVLRFVARRLVAEPVAMVLASRVGERGSVEGAGLDVLTLSGLARDAARTLLVEHGGSRLTPAEQDELLDASAGNPLAIREFVRAGVRPSPSGEPLPLAEGLRRAFRARVAGHDPDARRLLLLIAAAGAGQLDVVRKAAASLGVDACALESGALDELVAARGPGLRFRHPLIRSVVYHDAGPGDRRAAHHALAEALRSEPAEGDRRAWHRANAAEGSDETVAAELEAAAERAIRHAGPAAAAASLERAAELTPAPENRRRRLVAAASAWLQAGDTAQATTLLDGLDLAPSSRGALADQAVELRALIALRAGSPAEGVALLSRIVPNAVRAVDRAVDRDKTVRLLLLLGEAGFMAGALDVWPRIALAARELTERSAEPDDGLLGLLQAVYATLLGNRAELTARQIAALEHLDEPATLVGAAGMLTVTGHFELSRQYRDRAMRRARTLGAAGSLAWVLLSRVHDELLAGRLGTARAHAEEGHRLAGETGQPNTACRHQSLLALLAAHEGRSADAQRLAEDALTQATLHDLPDVTAWARQALGLNDLIAGRAVDALRQLEAMAHPGRTALGTVVHAVPDLVEAAARAGRPDRLDGELLARFNDWADNTRAPELLALAARCRALLAADDDVESEFAAALDLHAHAGWSVETARTQLLLGEHLRRRRRRADARGPLREALEGFTRLGALGWAARARAELRASGESGNDPAPNALAALTAQELRIAVAISEGATNREVAAQLFLSPRTVDYHLRKVFSKLGIANRAALVRLVIADHGVDR
ncbi:helix-turn-helix transcriptional regulator [Pseudonocardia acaciae]|uniref:helix-turn-helix transcriptional regulator n=1 Tax=Pseudonocardia acaciae TaxID=551276 RepID=UPI00048BF487|nr:LuxR family transcriptional regulator [Pseudonocardia acaciae]